MLWNSDSYEVELKRAIFWHEDSLQSTR